MKFATQAPKETLDPRKVFTGGESPSFGPQK